MDDDPRDWLNEEDGDDDIWQWFDEYELMAGGWVVRPAVEDAGPDIQRKDPSVRKPIVPEGWGCLYDMLRDELDVRGLSLCDVTSATVERPEDWFRPVRRDFGLPFAMEGMLEPKGFLAYTDELVIYPTEYDGTWQLSSVRRNPEEVDDD